MFREERVDVLIAGGGPAGLTLAYLLASKGFNVKLVEEHREIGEPQHCAGLVGVKCWSLLPVKSKQLITTVIRSFRFIHPGNGGVKELVLSRSSPIGYVIDRKLYEKKLAEAALDKGAEIEVNTRLSMLKIRKGRYVAVLRGEEGKVLGEANFIIYACGAYSKVAGTPARPASFYHGVQYDLDGVLWERADEATVYIGLREISFAWLLPLARSKQSRVGLIAGRRAGRLLRSFTKYLRCRLNRSVKVLNVYSGLIPAHPLTRLTRLNLVFIGDSAGQVKPISRGGLFYITVCARALADSIEKNLEHNLSSLKGYEKLWKTLLLREVIPGFLVRTLYETAGKGISKEILNFVSRSKILLEVVREEWDLDYQVASTANFLRYWLFSNALRLK